jgi:hypothetical protein
MFSWICPQCGREVPPSYTECPDCAAKGKVPPSPASEPAQPPANAPPVPQPAPPQYIAQPPQQSPYPAQYGPPQPPQYPQYAATPQYPQPPQYQQPQQYPPTQHAPQYAPQYAPPRAPGFRAAGLPTWLLTVIFALAFVGLVGGVYWAVGYFRGDSQAASPPANVENPAAKPVAKTSPLQKYVEISGIRFAEEAKKRIMVKFTVTNHSDADLSGLAGNVTVWARTRKSEEEAVGTFSFSADVPPDASKEVSAPLTTKLKMYELPDWQNVTTDVQITAPQ